MKSRSKDIALMRNIYVKYQNLPRLPLRKKLDDIKLLGETGIGSFHIAKIVRVTRVSAVEHIINPDGNIGGVRAWGLKFEPATLDALYLLAYQYEEDESVNLRLVENIAAWGCSLAVISLFTRIPFERLRNG